MNGLKKFYYVTSFLYIIKGAALCGMVAAVINGMGIGFVAFTAFIIVWSFVEIKRDWKRLSEGLPEKIEIVIDLEESKFKIEPDPLKSNADLWTDNKITVNLEY